MRNVRATALCSGLSDDVLNLAPWTITFGPDPKRPHVTVG